MVGAEEEGRVGVGPLMMPLKHHSELTPLF